MAQVKVDEQKAARKYLQSSNPLAFVPLFIIRGKVTLEFIEYIPTVKYIISFNPQ